MNSLKRIIGTNSETYTTTPDLYLHPEDMKIDASDNVYCAMQRPALTVTLQPHVYKLNSSGIKQWEKDPEGANNTGYGIELYDNETKVAVVTRRGGSPDNTLYTYEDDGTPLWGDEIDTHMRSVCRDGDDNLFVAHQDSISTITLVSKYDIDGNELARLNVDPAETAADINYFLG